MYGFYKMYGFTKCGTKVPKFVQSEKMKDSQTPLLPDHSLPVLPSCIISLILTCRSSIGSVLGLVETL